MPTKIQLNSLDRPKFESIDIMRGVAILMVILVHTSQNVLQNSVISVLCEYGQMGVQMFFVASAFTLSYSFEVRSSNDQSIIVFFIRRFFRIAPGYYLGILIYFLINVILNALNITSAWKSSDNPLDILINILFLNGLFPQANNNVVPGGWSIGTEMLFYIIFPVVFSIYRRFQYSKQIYLLIPVFALVFSLLLQWSILHFLRKHAIIFSNNRFIFFSIVNQLPVFLLGISMYFAFKDGLLKNIKTGISLIMCILLSILSGFLMFRGHSLFTLVYATTPFISALSFVFFFILIENKSLRSYILGTIGVLSYSGYLIHFLFAYFLTGFLAKEISFIHPNLKLILLYLLSVIFTFIMAKFTYRFIELKGISLGKKLIVKFNNQHHSVD